MLVLMKKKLLKDGFRMVRRTFLGLAESEWKPKMVGFWSDRQSLSMVRITAEARTQVNELFQLICNIVRRTIGTTCE